MGWATALIPLAIWGSKQTSDATKLVLAWNEVRSKQLVDKLATQTTPPDKLHPLVGQIIARTPALSAQAQTLGRQLDRVARERETLAETRDALPEGPAKDSIDATLGQLDQEHAATLAALVDLHRTAVQGVDQNPALVGLVSEVRLPTEAPAEAARERRTEREAQPD